MLFAHVERCVVDWTWVQVVQFAVLRDEVFGVLVFSYDEGCRLVEWCDWVGNMVWIPGEAESTVSFLGRINNVLNSHLILILLLNRVGPLIFLIQNWRKQVPYISLSTTGRPEEGSLIRPTW